MEGSGVRGRARRVLYYISVLMTLMTSHHVRTYIPLFLQRALTIVAREESNA